MSGEPPVVLTAHPLQRVGAYALVALAEVADIGDLTEHAFKCATERMAKDVAATATVEDAKSPGGFWLAASYLLWPNSKMNPTSRKKQLPAERSEQMRAWRTYPEGGLGLPCALCGREAGGFYGKVDVPLGASVVHRNTTPPGHDGLALCRGCLACFHALPYGCAIGGGRATAVHSWDDEFTRRAVCRQVERTRREASAGQPAGKAPHFARELTAFQRLYEYEHRLREGVDLYVFSNSNKEQVLDLQSLEQPLAEWLRKAMRDPRQAEGFRFLTRAHQTDKTPGPALLARNAFRNPERILHRAVGYLARRSIEIDAPTRATLPLAALSQSFAMEVLHVRERDAEQIQELAGRIADLLAEEPERGTLKGYEHVHRDPWRLQSWLKRQAVRWTLRPGQTTPLVTDGQWRLLFEADGQTRFHQDLLLISVLQSLARRNWRKDAVDEEAEEADEKEKLFGEEAK